MNAAQEAARALLDRETPEELRRFLNEQYGLDLAPGCTNLQALNARVKMDAENGNTAAQELINHYGIE